MRGRSLRAAGTLNAYVRGASAYQHIIFVLKYMISLIFFKKIVHSFYYYFVNYHLFYYDLFYFRYHIFKNRGGIYIDWVKNIRGRIIKFSLAWSWTRTSQQLGCIWSNV
jgi:hypothetical protein